MSNIFQELQMSSIVQDDDITAQRHKMNEILKIMTSMPEQEEPLRIFAEHVRSLDLQTLKDADAFFIDEEMPVTVLPEEYRQDSYGLCKTNYWVYSGRIVYPVKDVKGNVAGWCGYDKFEEPKYLDSLNYGYKAKRTMLWGMEKMEEYYASKKPVIVVEGIVCCMYLRQEKFQSLASLGSHLTPYVITILKRFGDNLIFITDADEAGNKYKKQVHYAIPNARVIQSRIAKDVDDSRKVDNNYANELRKVLSNRFYISKLYQ